MVHSPKQLPADDYQEGVSLFKIRIICSRPNNKRQKRSYNTMRKMMIMITVVVMILSSMSVYAESYVISNETIAGELMGLDPRMVTRTCKKCYKTQVDVYCTGATGQAPSAGCYVSSHPSGCQTVDRYYGCANAYCPTCGYSYHYDTTHIEKCRHTSTGSTWYNTCNYGPRE